MKKTGIAAIVLAASAVLGLASCQEFFTSSLGKWAERDASVPDNLTAAQAMSIAEQAETNCDTELAQALLPQMADFLSGTPSDELVAAAVSTAVLATGIDEAFGDALATIGMDIIENGGALTADQIDDLAAILESVAADTDAVDVFTYLGGQAAADMDAAGVTAADYVMAAAALLIEDQGDAATIAALIDGGAYTPGANDALIQDLISDASTQWPDDPLLDALQALFSTAL
jgi:hypothetical protein